MRINNLLNIFATMRHTADRLFLQARMLKRSVHIQLEDEESVIFKGIKIIKNEDGIKIYSTNSDFYREILKTDDFFNEGFEYGAFRWLQSKYKNVLDKIEEGVQSEISSRKNHKRIAFLKASRQIQIHKYNETTRRIEQIERRQALLR